VVGKALVRKIRRAKKLAGEVVVPGDKSISHRAAILCSLASGLSEIGNFSPGNDCLSTLNCLKSLGVKIRNKENVSAIIYHGEV